MSEFLNLEDLIDFSNNGYKKQLLIFYEIMKSQLTNFSMLESVILSDHIVRRKVLVYGIEMLDLSKIRKFSLLI